MIATSEPIEPENLSAAIRRELREHADAQILDTNRRFFKEEIKAYGMRSATVARIAKKFLPELRHKDKVAVFRLAEQLFSSGYMEEFMLACEFVYSRHKEFAAADFPRLEQWLSRYVSNWAECDVLCNHSVGACVEQFPELTAELRRWTASSNRWMRRAAAVTLIIPAKHGDFLDEALEIADLLLEDHEDLVQKGYGWLLKEASRRHQAVIFRYVMERKARMPRTALRYAIELMPPELRAEAMKK